MKVCLTVILCLFLHSPTLSSCQNVVVGTKTGHLRGELIQQSSEQFPPVYQFLGVPFAQPPLGQLRFKKPTPLQPWNFVRNATKLASACTQYIAAGPDGQIEKGSEDCLYLNIWTPQNAINSSSNQNSKRSVLVFIHGGEFSTGSIKDPVLNGTFLASLNNIIVVTIQYRLGGLGFSYFGNEDCPGNMGLWDQLEALKWLHANIETFGGNPNDTTLAGEGAGAASVACHLVSPHSRNMFKKAIMTSGSINTAWALHSTAVARNATKLLFSQLCHSFDNFTCLRAAAASGIPVAEQNPKFADIISGNIFVPVVDGDFLPRNPVEMMQTGDFNKVPIMMGVTKDEGSLALMSSSLAATLLPSPANPDRSLDDLTFENFNQLIKSRFGNIAMPDVNPLILQSIQLHYWPNSSGSDIYRAVSEAEGDYSIVCPVVTWLNLTARFLPRQTFAYLFTHRRSQHWAYDFMGVLQGDELAFIFGEPFASTSLFEDNERQLASTMMAYVGNFAKYGDPNGASLRMWPQYVGYGGSCQREYFEINAKTPFTSQGTASPTICEMKKRNCEFWEDFIPKMAKMSFSGNNNKQQQLAISASSNNLTPADDDRSSTKKNSGSGGSACLFITTIFLSAVTTTMTLA